MIGPLIVGASLIAFLIWKSKQASGTAAITQGDDGTGLGNNPASNSGSGGHVGYLGPAVQAQTSAIGTKLAPTGQSIWDVRPPLRKIGFNNDILYCGGGGPENRGATPTTDIAVKLPITQPSWWSESDDDYYGYATKSHVPITAGGGVGQKADDFRSLGDNFGARQ